VPALVSAQSDASNDQKLQQLGELLNASHTSCSQLYQCSCEELDTLVGVARTAGALGARLTGGGAARLRTVHACPYVQDRSLEDSATPSGCTD
jgi:galactokinase/mevalonate kinase-like predicted kinase